MSEVTFAKGFLATLDKRAIKLPSDHASDPRKYPSESPYIVPRQTHPFPRRQQPASTQQANETSITTTLKPMRSGETVTLTDNTLNTSIHDLKAQYAQKTGQAQDKIKLLLKKKPAADLKTLKELGVSGHVELSVMIMGAGGGTTPIATTPAVEKTEPMMPPSEKMDIDSQAPALPSEIAETEVEEKAALKEVDPAASILKTEEFWNDLTGFLAQRLRDQKEGEKLAKLFREAWTKR